MGIKLKKMIRGAIYKYPGMTRYEIKDSVANMILRETNFPLTKDYTSEFYFSLKYMHDWHQIHFRDERFYLSPLGKLVLKFDSLSERVAKYFSK